MDNSFTDDPFFNGSYPEPGQIDPPNRSLECDAFLPSLGPNPATRIPDRDSTALSATSPASHHARHGSVNQQPLEQWLADPGVRPAVIGSPTDLPVFQNSREAYPILVPGQAAEQVTRYKQNMKCLHWPVRQSQNEMAEAGFIISDDKSYFSCQYCSYPLTFDALRCDSDLWTFHFEECNHLHMHHMEQRKKARDICSYSVPQSSSAMHGGQEFEQLTCSVTGGQQSGNIIGQSAEIIATDAEGGIYTLHGPVKFRQHAEYTARLKTFSKVPSSVVKKPKELAGAGFMYAGTEDRVICFSCGGGFRNWQHTDDPWKEHAHMFPDCTYITHVKGFQFVQQAGISALSAPNQPETQASEASCDNQQPLGSMTNYSVLSLEKQRKYPSDKELAQLSRNIGKEFMQLGLELDLPFCQVQQIEIEYSTVSNRCLAILTEWRSAQAGRATLGDLEKVFRKLNIDTMVFNQL